MVKKLIIPLCLLTHLAVSQTILQCKQRFNNYLNFRNSLNGTVRFEDDVLYILEGGKKEFAVYKDELPMLADFFANSTVREQEKLMRAKGLKKFTKRERDSLAINVDSKIVVASENQDQPLKNIRIALDPGHFGTNLADAQVEQKFLYFVKDPLKFPNDTVKIFESTLTFNTAAILKRLLEEQGATVFLTREQSNFTSFNCTFGDWMLLYKKRTLDSLFHEKILAPERYRKLLKCNDYIFFWDFFRDFDLANRANKINNYNPHFTIIIHYNVDEKNVPWKAHTKKNFSMAFIGGGFTAKDLQRNESRMHFLRLLLTNQLEQSEHLAAKTVGNFNKNLGIPIARASDATYLAKNCIATKSQGVFCRNLILCRKINSPLVYGESLYQDNELETDLLMKSDVDLYGIKTNERLKKVALSYFEAVMAFVADKN